jgi:hypothetical protein
LTRDSREELLTALLEIERWEKEQKDLFIWEKVLRLPFVLLDRFTPASIRNKIGSLLDEMGAYVTVGGKYVIEEAKVLSFLREASGNKDLVPSDVEKLPLQTMIEISSKVTERNKTFAQVQGAVTGAGGVFTLAADIPAVLGLSLKVLQEIAYAYGYVPKQEEERVFIVKCLQFASSDVVGKRAVLKELSSMGMDGTSKRQVISSLQGWREVIAAYRDNMGWKKLIQMVPLLGLFIGAYFNKKLVEEVAEVGDMLYQKRRTLEKLELLRTESAS